MNERLEAFKTRARARYGAEKCDFTEIDATDASIRDAYESGQRVIFDYSNDGIKPARGYVGVTTGWRPAFIRLFNRRSAGGCDILTHARAVGLSGKRRPAAKGR